MEVHRTMASIIQVRRGLASEWSSHNPTLSSGEFGLETDTNKIKIGDGTTVWDSLNYLMPFNLGDLLDVSQNNPNNDDVLIYDSANTTWNFIPLSSFQFTLPFKLATTGATITKSDDTEILKEINGTAILENVTFGSNIGGLGSLALSSNVYKLKLSDDATEIIMYTADPVGDLTLEVDDQYIIATNINFEIQNNNLVMVV